MFLDPEIEIRPEGFKLTTGLDDAIWFKFTVNTNQINDVFLPDIVDTSQFEGGYFFSSDDLPAL